MNGSTESVELRTKGMNGASDMRTCVSVPDQHNLNWTTIDDNESSTQNTGSTQGDAENAMYKNSKKLSNGESKLGKRCKTITNDRGVVEEMLNKMDEARLNKMDATASEAEQLKREKRRIMRNAFVLSLAFMVQFTAFTGTSNLQSSVNAENGLGTASLTAIYIAMMLSTIFLPVLVLKWLGSKWTLAACFVLYMPYILVQVHADFSTLVPAAVIAGIGAGPVWSAQCMYFSVIAEPLSRITGTSTDSILARFFGVFYMVYQLSEVWGNLISSLVFSVRETPGPADNRTKLCGILYVPGQSAENNTNMDRPPDHQIYTLTGLYFGCMVVAVLIIALGMDSLQRYNERGRKGSGTGLSGVQLLMVTLGHLRESRQLLLLPLTVWMGLAQVFKGADYTAAFVSCAWGISNIGYVMICYGVTHSLSALVAGFMVKFTGRPLMLTGAALVHAALLMALFVWDPTSGGQGSVILFFVVSGIWGTMDGIWLVQVNSLYGVLFPGKEEAAYGNFRIWKSFGYIVAYSYSPYLATDIKLYILLSFLALGISGYLLIIVLDRRKQRVVPS